MLTDLAGRTYVVTGSSTGIGRATALALAARGGHVVLACRSVERACPVADEIERSRLAGTASIVELDLADLGSVHRAAAEIAEHHPCLDALVNNAGVAGARGATKDGVELAFGVNHLGHYLLTRLLLPRLVPGARIVHVSSGSHARVRGVDFSALARPTQSLTGIDEYAVSKLCVMLFHHELARRMAADAVDATTHAADPGDVASDAWRHVPWPVRPILVARMRSPEEGSRTSVFCATAPELPAASGGYYKDERLVAPSALSLDASLARALWDLSAQLAELPS